MTRQWLVQLRVEVTSYETAKVQVEAETAEEAEKKAGSENFKLATFWVDAGTRQRVCTKIKTLYQLGEY